MQSEFFAGPGVATAKAEPAARELLRAVQELGSIQISLGKIGAIDCWRRRRQPVRRHSGRDRYAGCSGGTWTSSVVAPTTPTVTKGTAHGSRNSLLAGTIQLEQIRSDTYGGDRPVQQGWFNLLVDTQDPARKAMDYRLHFIDAQNRPRTLIGFKDVRSDDHSDIWTDTTTLYTRILEGHVTQEADPGATILAAGIIRIHMLDFLKELTTFRVEGANIGARASALTRFGTLFLGKLWDVYAHRVLPESPF